MKSDTGQLPKPVNSLVGSPRAGCRVVVLDDEMAFTQLSGIAQSTRDRHVQVHRWICRWMLGMPKHVRLTGPFGLALLLAGGAFFATSALADGAEWSAIVDDNKAAVVVVETDLALGSGFFVRPNGMLVTNKHVIEGASQITVTLSSGEKFHKAFVLAEDSDRDLAILRVEGSGLPSLPLAHSSEIKVAQDVLLIGAPQGLSYTVSSGMVRKSETIT